MPPKSKSRKRGRSGRPKAAPQQQIPADILAQIDAAWNTIDSDAEGNIDGRQSRQLMKNSLGLNVKKSDFQGMDTMDYDTFCRFAADKMIQKEKATRAFSLFDKDKKGLVVLEDIQRVATELGESFTTEELEEMLNEVDQSGEGLLTTEDFVKLAKKVGL